jgi:hypothetical protein
LINTSSIAPPPLQSDAGKCRTEKLQPSSLTRLFTAPDKDAEGLTVIARSTCDEAIQFTVQSAGLLRFARNDDGSDATLTGCTHARSPLPQQ